MNKRLLLVIVFLTVFIASAVRIYKIDTNYYFSGELGKELLYTRLFSEKNTLPLTGMPTSHEWLSYGPLYYWILIPIYKLFNGDPYILFWLSTIISIFALLLNYLVVNKIFNLKVALISTLIQAISPLFIWQTRLSKLHVFFWVLVPIYIYVLSRIWNGDRKYIFLLGLVFGIMFSFHFSQVPWFIIPMALFFIKKTNFKISDIGIYLGGVVLPNITLLWQDKGLIVWLPYRVFSTAGKGLMGTFQSFNEFFGKMFFWQENMWVVASVATILLFAYFVGKNFKKITSDFKIFMFISTIGVTLAANFLHGSPPVHYFLPIFTIVPIFVAYYLQNKINLTFLFIPLFIVNISAFSNNVLFYKYTDKLDPEIDFVPISVQKAAVNFIVSDSNGKEFSIKRIGPYDYFPENYSQNYKYLSYYYNGNLVDSSNNIYTIVEDQKTGRINVQK